MKSMKKLIGAAMLAGAAIAGSAGVAHADGTWSGNIALATDYEFRGLSQTNGNPAVQGGLDYVNGQFYAGTWASNVSFSNGPELDFYAGFTPTLGPVALNLGVIGYFYPGARDDAAEFDYYEAKAAGTITPVSGLSLTGSAYYSPDFFGETGTAFYTELAGAYTINDALSISGAFGHQTIDDVNGPAPGSSNGNYNTWNLGVTYTLQGFAIDARYVDTDINPTDSIATYAGTDQSVYDAAFVLSIKRTL